MASRGKSVPPRTPAPDLLDNELSIKSTPFLASNSAPGPSRSMKLINRAENLAKMTFELNIRAVSAQTERLQRDVQNLVVMTAEEKEFRRQHEDRLSKLWQEMLVIKQHMTKVGDGKDPNADFDRVQQETSTIIEEFRGEIGDLRGLIEDISKQIEEFPATSDTHNDSGYFSQTGDVMDFELSQTQGTNVTEPDPEEAKRNDEPPRHSEVVNLLVDKGHDREAVLAASRRIVQTIQSTKRWNSDYKKTPLTEGEFCANYLKQQAKRDNKMAVYIQKNLLAFIRLRRCRSGSRPRSLEEFCQDVKWKDVLDIVQELLVKKKESTIKALMK